MSRVDDVMDQAEMMVAELLVMQQEGRKHTEPEVDDLMIASNILVGGMIFCATAGVFSHDQIKRAQSIGALYTNNTNHFGQEP